MPSRPRLRCGPQDIKLKGDAIKTIGKYEAEVAFHRDVVRSIPFEVVEE
jgi:ribosomal protein L9